MSLAKIGACAVLFLFVGVSGVFSQSKPESVDASVNREPLLKWAELSKKEIENGLDLSSPFHVELSTRLDRSGKFDTGSTKWMRSDGNPRLVALVKDAIISISDSGYFAYLVNLFGSELNLSIHQDKDNFGSEISSALKTENQAKTRAASLRILIEFSIHTKEKPDASPADKKDLELLRSISVESSGSEVILKSSMPTATFRQIVADALK